MSRVAWTEAEAQRTHERACAVIRQLQEDGLEPEEILAILGVTFAMVLSRAEPDVRAALVSSMSKIASAYAGDRLPS